MVPMTLSSRILSKGLALTAGLALMACASTEETGDGPTARAQATETGQSARTAGRSSREAPMPGALTTDNLEPGTCGMLLWALEGTKPQLVFRHTDNGAAQMMIGGEPVRLELIDSGGEQRYGIAARQVFVLAQNAAEATEVRVNAVFGIPFDGGTYVEKGLITLRNSDGWERVTPVAGLAGCRA